MTKLLTLAEWAKLNNIKIWTAYRLLRAGKIEVTKEEPRALTRLMIREDFKLEK